MRGHLIDTIKGAPEPVILGASLVALTFGLAFSAMATYTPPEVISVKDQSRYTLSPVITDEVPFKLASVGDVTIQSKIAIRTPSREYLRGLNYGGLPGPLQSFLHLVQSQCGGFVIISAFRKNARVRGSGARSLHASGLAADYQVSDPSCALRLAAGFSGGHSIDYRAVNHFHASWAPGSREYGSRFAHYRGGRYATRVATKYKKHHRKTRYARRHHRRA